MKNMYTPVINCNTTIRAIKIGIIRPFWGYLLGHISTRVLKLMSLQNNRYSLCARQQNLISWKVLTPSSETLFNRSFEIVLIWGLPETPSVTRSKPKLTDVRWVICVLDKSNFLKFFIVQNAHVSIWKIAELAKESLINLSKCLNVSFLMTNKEEFCISKYFSFWKLTCAEAKSINGLLLSFKLTTFAIMISLNKVTFLILQYEKSTNQAFAKLYFQCFLKVASNLRDTIANSEPLNEGISMQEMALPRHLHPYGQ